MIGTVENAVLDVLRDAGAGNSNLLGYDYRTLESYPDDFDQYLAEQKGQLRMPAAWCVFLALGPCDDVEGGDLQGEARFALVVAAQNLRNETATRHGGVGTAEPGSYQLAIDAIRLLSDNDLGLPLVHRVAITGARLVSRTAAMVKQGMSLMAIELRCTIPLDKFMTGDIGDFARMHVDWDIPPHGNVAPPLPAAEADARDDVEVPQ